MTQVEVAIEAARRAAEPTKPILALGFLTGQAMDWLPKAMRALRDELLNIDVTVSIQYSADLAQALLRGRLHAAFMRPEAQMPDLDYRVVSEAPLVRLARRSAPDIATCDCASGHCEGAIYRHGENRAGASCGH